MAVAYRPRAIRNMSDEAVVEFAQRGDEEAREHLLRKYRNVVLFKSRTLFIQGAEREDMIQEGMVGLYKAIRDFRRGHGCSFRTFADSCITRQMITATKGGVKYGKTAVLYEYSLRIASRDEDATNPLENAPDDSQNPVHWVIARETADELETSLRAALSTFEWTVFMMFMDGTSYQKIADELGCRPKSVDNALCRIRRKMDDYRQDNNGNNRHARTGPRAV